MANIKSSQKDIRRIKRRTEHNRTVKSTLKTLNKSFYQAVSQKEDTVIVAAGQRYISALDKAAKRKIISKNKANRHKSACAKHFPKPAQPNNPVAEAQSSDSNNEASKA